MRIYTTARTGNYYGGTLYHRVRGKYFSADTPDAGPFYYRYVKQDGTVFTKCLETEDPYEAASVAKGMYLALTKNEAKGKPSIRMEEVWDLYEEAEQKVSDSSMDDYKQIFRRFRNWTNKHAPKKFRGRVKFAEDVTDELCKIYARSVCDAKTSGPRDLSILKGIWSLIFPHNHENPWEVGIRPKVKPRSETAHARMILPDEARRFREAIRKEAEEWPNKEEDKRSNVLTPEFLHDLYDAVAFAWWYGMRVGSLASLNWKDFSKSDEWFLHTPPKTQNSKYSRPLQLPIVPEIAEILERRKKDSKSEWIFPVFHAQYNKKGTARERKYGYEMKRSATRTGQAEFARDVKKLFKEAGIEDDFNGRASMHGFRKSTTNMLEAGGATIYLIRSILGWQIKNAEDCYLNGQTVERKREMLLKCIPPLSEQLPGPAPQVDRTEIERIIDEL